jgi:hypothetical protein
MSIDEITDFVEGLGGVLTLEPEPGDGSPEISWGDRFFYYAPDGVVPRTQPFATIVTKDYPDDQGSRLDRPDTFRLNVAAGSEAFSRWTGRSRRQVSRPGDEGTDVQGVDPSEEDVVLAHPVYGSLGWLAVVNPGPRTEEGVRELLMDAHDAARARAERRESGPGQTA